MAGQGLNLDASASQSSSAATGATKFGNTTQFVLGGSNGISVTMILIIVGTLGLGWFLFFRKK